MTQSGDFHCGRLLCKSLIGKGSGISDRSGCITGGRSRFLYAIDSLCLDVRSVTVADTGGSALTVIIAPCIGRLTPVVTYGLYCYCLHLLLKCANRKRSGIGECSALLTSRRCTCYHTIDSLGLNVRSIAVADTGGGALAVIIAPCVCRLTPVMTQCLNCHCGRLLCKSRILEDSRISIHTSFGASGFSSTRLRGGYGFRFLMCGIKRAYAFCRAIETVPRISGSPPVVCVNNLCEFRCQGRFFVSHREMPLAFHIGRLDLAACTRQQIHIPSCEFVSVSGDYLQRLGLALRQGELAAGYLYIALSTDFLHNTAGGRICHNGQRMGFLRQIPYKAD